MTTYLCDVLPIHPRPYPGEALTGYLSRLCLLNGIPSVFALNKLLFPNRQCAIWDAPLPSFGHLAEAVQCRENDLRALTFYWLHAKFNRIGVPNFLSGSVATHRRYCPHCLAERAYYALAWRLVALRGCAEHHCALLDHCAHCGHRLPLLAGPFYHEQCPTCRGDLRRCPPKRLSGQDAEAVERWQVDLDYLLSPQPWEAEETQIPQSLAPLLTFLRWQRGIAKRDLAQVLNVGPEAIEHLEHPTRRRSALFSVYVGYGQALDLSWREVFLQLEQNYRQHACDPQRLKEAGLVQRVSTALQSLQQADQPVNQRSVARLARTPLPALKTHPIAVQLLGEAVQCRRQRQKAKREQRLLEAVQAAATDLLESGQILSHAALAARVGMDARSLARYPAVKQLLSQLTGRAYQRQLRDQRKQVLLSQAPAVIDQLSAEGIPIQLRTVSSRLGLSPAAICKHHPQLRALIAKAAQTQRQVAARS